MSESAGMEASNVVFKPVNMNNKARRALHCAYLGRGYRICGVGGMYI